MADDWITPSAPAPEHDDWITPGAKPQAASAATPKGGFWRNVGAGLEEIPAMGLSGAASVLRLNDRLGNPFPMLPNSGGLPELMDRGAAASTKGIGNVTGLKPDEVPQTTFTDRLGRNLGHAAPMLVDPAAGLPNAIRSGVTGLGSVLGQTVAQQFAPHSTAAQIAGSLIGGHATGAATMAPSAIARATARITPEEAATNYAADQLRKSGRTVGSLDAYGARTAGKGATAAEAMGPGGVKALGALGTREGATGDTLSAMLQERAEGLPGRVMGDFHQSTGIDPDAALGDIQKLVEKGRKNAEPLYKKAFEGGGKGAFVSPLQDQFGQHSANVAKTADAVADAERDATLAAANVHNAGDNVYGANSALQEQRAAEARLAEAQAAHQQAAAQKDAVLTRLQRAQQDEAEGVRGGVWSPRIQQFLDDPILKRGIGQGLEIERLEALEKDVPFNAKEYAVNGKDAEGNPIISGVPNMRVLDAGKRGLDQIINEQPKLPSGALDMSNYRTQKLVGVKNAYLRELDILNGDYGAARGAASDYLGAKGAFDNSAKIFSNSNVTAKQFTDQLGKLEGTDLEAAKGGVANWLFNQAQKGLLTGRTFNKPILQQKLTAVIGDPAKAKAFLDKMKVESDLAKSGSRMAPGVNSRTFDLADAASEQDRLGAGMDAAHAVKHLVGQNYTGALAKGASALQKIGAFPRTAGMSVPVRDAAGKLMMGSPTDLASHLRSHAAELAAREAARPKFPVRGLVPAITPALAPQQQSPYRRGGFI